MREIRIKSQNLVEDLTWQLADGYDKVFFVSEEDYEKMKMLSAFCSDEDLMMGFIKSDDECTIETIIKFRKFCARFYVIDSGTRGSCEDYSRP